MTTTKQLILLVGLTSGLFASTSGLADDDSKTNSPAGEVRAEDANPVAQTPEQPTPAPTPAQATAPDQTPQPATVAPADTKAQPAIVTAQDSATNNAAEFSQDKGLRMNFRDVPLEMVLS